MNCYLCDHPILLQVTWRSIFSNEPAQVICTRCQAGFERLPTGCPICGAKGKGKCHDCVQWDTTSYAGVLDSGTSLYDYNVAMRDYLHRYKFLQDVVLAEVFASVLKDHFQKQKSVIVPIPMNKEKLKRRTFSQVDQLLEAASVSYTHLLEKNEVVLGGKTKEQRLALKDVFCWNGQPVPEKIVLFDDLYTTGSTMRLAANVLKEHGATEINILTLIRA